MRNGMRNGSFQSLCVEGYTSVHYEDNYSYSVIKNAVFSIYKAAVGKTVKSTRKNTIVWLEVEKMFQVCAHQQKGTIRML